jgi:hypothetical protein
MSGAGVSERVVVILGFAVVFAATAAAIVVSHVRRGRLATIAETVDHLTRTRAVKIVAVLVWGWLGWHFLAR